MSGGSRVHLYEFVVNANAWSCFDKKKNAIEM